MIGNNSLEVFALLDSGADFTLIPRAIADIIGIKLNEKDKESIGGVGGNSFAYKVQLTCSLKLGHESNKIQIKAMVLDEENEEIPVLIGREGFFENFEITFREYEKKILIKKVYK